MKWILAILLLISASAIGQVDDTTKYISYPTQYGMKIPRIWAPTTMIMPYGDTTGKRPGKIGAFMTCTCDGKPYRWDGSNWVAFGGSSADSSIFSTNYRRDTAIANIRTQLAGKQPTGNYITALTGDVTATGPGSATATIATNAVTNSKFRQSVGLSVVGNSTNSTANVTDITASSDNQVLRRSGTGIGWGAVNLASSNAVTGVLPWTNIDTATIKNKISDTLIYALKSILIPSRLEFIASADTATYQDNALIGSQIMMLSIESYQVGFTTRSTSVYMAFDATTGTISLTNGKFNAGDQVIVIYRTPPVFLLDGSGNPVRDSSGNFIILN